VGLKVLVIGAYPLEPGKVHGGVESATSVLVPALAAQDDIDNVAVLCFHHGEASTDYRRAGPKVEVHYVRGQERLCLITGWFLDVRKARKLVAALKPDIVHGQAFDRGDIAVKCSPNSVVTVHGLPHAEMRLSARMKFGDKLRVKVVDAVVRRVLRRAKVVISISKYDTQELGQLIQGTPVSIANPTGLEFFALAPSRPSEPRLLFAGVLTPRKNVVGLLNAFAQVRQAVPEARLIMAGPHPDPDYAQTVRDRVTSLALGDSVDIVGLLDNDRLRHEIATARAVVLFSRQETAPTIIAQAMAAGKPVVAARVGGVAEMVNDGESGFVVESEDETALAERMLTLLNDQDLCLRMGARGRELALCRFNPEAVARQTVEAYRTALCPSKSSVGLRSRLYLTS
jgi:glycosyltransferase involved in cell wall biosynthesis